MSWHLEKLAWNPELADLGSSALESTVPDTEQEEAQQKQPFDPVCSPPHIHNPGKGAPFWKREVIDIDPFSLMARQTVLGPGSGRQVRGQLPGSDHGGVRDSTPCCHYLLLSEISRNLLMASCGRVGSDSFYQAMLCELGSFVLCIAQA